MSEQFKAEHYLFKAPPQMWHLGTLDVKDKGNRGHSQEGVGLSVSDQPEEWARIAKLGGVPKWVAPTKGLKFIDGYELLESHSKELVDWGLEHNLVHLKTAYAYSYYDDELGMMVETLHSSLDEVAKELGYENGEELKRTSDYIESVFEINATYPNLTLLQRLAQPLTDEGKPSALVIEFLATLWAQEQKVDGIWWQVDHEKGEVAYSANRAVVFPDSIEKVVWEKEWDPEYKSGSKFALKP